MYFKIPEGQRNNLILELNVQGQLLQSLTVNSTIVAMTRIHTQVSRIKSVQVMAKEPLRHMLIFSHWPETEHSLCCSHIRSQPVLITVSVTLLWVFFNRSGKKELFLSTLKQRWNLIGASSVRHTWWGTLKMKSDFDCVPSTYLMTCSEEWLRLQECLALVLGKPPISSFFFKLYWQIIDT